MSSFGSGVGWLHTFSEEPVAEGQHIRSSVGSGAGCRSTSSGELVERRRQGCSVDNKSWDP